MNTWVIADTHFHHSNIIEYENRPFLDVLEMNDTLIANWNSVVKKSDIVIHLGDFSFGSLKQVTEITQKLFGNIILVMGNHDRQRTTSWWVKAGMHMVFKEPFLMGDTVLSHEPVYMPSTFLGKDRVVNIHGHKHGHDYDDIFPMKYLNVSVERTGYTPINLYTLMIRRFYEEEATGITFKYKEGIWRPEWK